MNPEAQAKLDELLAQEPAALTEEDIAFLNARRSYLTDDQVKEYGLDNKVKAETSEDDESSKKSKK